MLFAHTIQSWEDWADVYQSIPAFTPLIQEIFRREGLPFSPLSPLTPGTNAVFRSGELVVKVFFPRESGLDPEGDFQNEGAVCRLLTQRQVPVPQLLATCAAGLWRISVWSTSPPPWHGSSPSGRREPTSPGPCWSTGT